MPSWRKANLAGLATLTSVAAADVTRLRVGQSMGVACDVTHEARSDSAILVGDLAGLRPQHEA